MTKTENKAVRRLYTFDNLPILRCMDSESVDLIYLDPPFNSGRQWENPIEAGGKKALASFKDTWALSDIHVDEAWALGRYRKAAIPLIDSLYKINGGSWRAYLIYMGVRLAQMHRVLKPTGSIYFHCDPVMSHGVKLLMDAIFGKNNFRNEIVWCYSGGGVPKRDFPRKHDVILRYSKTEKRIHNTEYKPYKENTQQVGKHSTYSGGHAINLKRGTPVTDWWTDVKTATGWAAERVGYPTQKPMALLERIIKASSNPGDVVLDPFCGCATTCVAAERLNRQWIGIDLSETAREIVLDRLKKETELPLINPDVVEHLTKLPKRTDLPKRTPDDVIKEELYARQGGRCVAPCGDEIQNGRRLGRKVDMDFMDIDHIIAKTRGGQDVDSNLQLLCRKCNLMKSGDGMERLRRRIFKKKEREEREAARAEWEKEFSDEED